MIRTPSRPAVTPEQVEQIAWWVTDHELGRMAQPPHEIARQALSLRSDRGFRRRIASVGAAAAARGMTAAALAATAIQRLGHVGAAYLDRLDPALRQAATRDLVELQAGVAEALLRGYASVTPLDASPTRREQLLDETVRALDRINSAVNSSLELEEVLRLTVETVADLLKVSEVTIYLYEPSIDRLVLRGTKAFEPAAIGRTTLAIGEGLIGWVAHIGQPVAVRDVWADPRFKYVPGIGEETLRSFLAVPIVLFTVNRLIGAINVASTQFRDFTSEEVRFAEITAGQLAIAVENARLHQQTDEELHHKVEQLTSVQNLARTLVSNLDSQSVLTQLARQAAELTGVEKAAIWQIDETREEMRVVATYNMGAAYARHTLSLGEGVVGRVVATHAPVVVTDAFDDARLLAPRELIEEEGYRSMCSVPLIVGDHAVGAISLYRSEPGEFTQEQTDLAFTFGNHAAIALENARLFEEVRQGLETKSLLLREMHHRVKNNMQTIASLLGLQARRAHTDEAGELLRLSAGRIAGMARVHDLLSEDDLGHTTVRAIAEAMLDLMRADLSASGDRFELSIDAADVQISSDKATVFALVVNELLWNAVQHGLEGRSSGAIRVEARADGSNVHVSVIDDGAGLTDEFMLDRDMGLGLTIVRNLVERNLEGSFLIQPRADGPGTSASFRFEP